MKENIRPVKESDLVRLREVLESSQLFPSEYLDDMISDYLREDESQDFWFTYVDQGVPVAIGYCVPETLTAGTYNLLAIGVHHDFQKKGIAKLMMGYIEYWLKEKGGRILIVETSSVDAQIAARSLYQKIGYNQEAVIRDFWQDGEDKIVYWKKLV